MTVLVGVAFIIVGAVFAWGAVRPNTFCGVRTRWTLADEFVWARSNEVAGQLLMLWGTLLVVAGEIDGRQAVLFLLVPGLLVAVVPVVHGALTYRRRYGSLHVRRQTRFRGQVPSSVVVEAALLAIPLLGLMITQHVAHRIPPVVPLRISLSGAFSHPGPTEVLGNVHTFALVLWFILAIAIQYQRAVERNVFWAYVLLRGGALFFVEGLVAATLLAAVHEITNAWMVLAWPVGAMTAGLTLLLFEATSVGPGAIDVRGAEEREEAADGDSEVDEAASEEAVEEQTATEDESDGTNEPADEDETVAPEDELGEELTYEPVDEPPDREMVEALDSYGDELLADEDAPDDDADSNDGTKPRDAEARNDEGR